MQKAKKFSVEIEDLAGRVIFRDKYSAETERVLHPNVAPGIYLVKLVDESGEILETQKLTLE